ncbi:MAG: J domain-containing protein, partial [Isosphaeraceae bacterium]
MSSFTFDIDPQAVLGVSADATLEQIRDAYRRKCKTFHPDAGGEEWAFRVLVQSYELLSTARVLRATRAEPVRGQAES